MRPLAAAVLAVLLLSPGCLTLPGSPPTSFPSSPPPPATHPSGGNATPINGTAPANGTSPPGNAPPPPSPAAPVFGEPVTLPADTNASEPSVVVDKDGALFVSAPPGLSRVSYVWRSTDGGASFQQLTNVFPSAGGNGRGGGDSAVATDAQQGTEFASDLSASGLVASVSTDGGKTWCASSFGASLVPGDRQWLAAGHGKGFLVYRTLVSGGPPQTLISTYTPAPILGCNWLPGAPVGSDALLNGNLVMEPDGSLDLVYVASTDNGASLDAVRLARSTDGGGTWTHADVAQGHDVANVFPSIATDPDGGLYAAWADSAEGTHVLLAHSLDHGAHWTAPARVVAGNGTEVFPWIVAGARGQVELTMYATNVGGNPNDLNAMGNATWDVLLAQSTDALDPQPAFSLASVAKAVHVGTICTQGTACTPRNGPPIDRDLGDFLTVALLADGRAAVAYARDGAGSGASVEVAVQASGPTLGAG